MCVRPFFFCFFFLFHFFFFCFWSFFYCSELIEYEIWISLLAKSALQVFVWRLFAAAIGRLAVVDQQCVGPTPPPLTKWTPSEYVIVCNRSVRGRREAASSQKTSDLQVLTKFQSSSSPAIRIMKSAKPRFVSEKNNKFNTEATSKKISFCRSVDDFDKANIFIESVVLIRSISIHFNCVKR